MACARATICGGPSRARPDLDLFAASTDPRWARQRPNAACQVDGCNYGVARRGLCQLHAQRWTRSGRPDLDGWLAAPPRVKTPTDEGTCRIDCCRLWPQAQLPFCHAHAATWRANGRPDIDAFAARFVECGATEEETVRLGALPPRLRLEVQYALQCRADERATKTLPSVVMRTVRFLAGTAETTLLDRSEAQWRTAFDEHAPADPNARSLLIYARRPMGSRPGDYARRSGPCCTGKQAP